MIKKLFLPILLLITTNSFSKTLPAHEHGSVRIDLAVEKDTLLVMLHSPSESFLGFEYKAKSKKEKDLVRKVKREWKQEITSFIGPTTLKKCKITSTKWTQKFTSSSHSDVIAESYIKCSSPLAEKTIAIDLMKKYPKVKKLRLQLIRNDGSAFSKTYTNSNINLKL